jgi:hypothetical protein
MFQNKPLTSVKHSFNVQQLIIFWCPGTNQLLLRGTSINVPEQTNYFCTLLMFPPEQLNHSLMFQEQTVYFSASFYRCSGTISSFSDVPNKPPTSLHHYINVPEHFNRSLMFQDKPTTSVRHSFVPDSCSRTNQLRLWSNPLLMFRNKWIILWCPRTNQLFLWVILLMLHNNWIILWIILWCSGTIESFSDVPEQTTYFCEVFY